MGCENCEYAPTTYEEYCMGNGCADAFTENAKNCNKYDDESGNSMDAPVFNSYCVTCYKLSDYDYFFIDVSDKAEPECRLSEECPKKVLFVAKDKEKD